MYESVKKIVAKEASKNWLTPAWDAKTWKYDGKMSMDSVMIAEILTTIYSGQNAKDKTDEAIAFKLGNAFENLQGSFYNGETQAFYVTKEKKV